MCVCAKNRYSIFGGCQRWPPRHGGRAASALAPRAPPPQPLRRDGRPGGAARDRAVSAGGAIRQGGEFHFGAAAAVAPGEAAAAVAPGEAAAPGREILWLTAAAAAVMIMVVTVRVAAGAIVRPQGGQGGGSPRRDRDAAATERWRLRRPPARGVLAPEPPPPPPGPPGGTMTRP